MTRLWGCRILMKSKRDGIMHVMYYKKCREHLKSGICSLDGKPCGLIEYAPVRVAEWIHNKSEKCFVCSCCGHKEDREFPYCNCGAKMK